MPPPPEHRRARSCICDCCDHGRRAVMSYLYPDDAAPLPEPRPGLSAKIAITGMPEVLAVYRREMAQILRDAADDEPAEVAARLRYYADIFETGQDEDQ